MRTALHTTDGIIDCGPPVDGIPTQRWILTVNLSLLFLPFGLLFGEGWVRSHRNGGSWHRRRVFFFCFCFLFVFHHATTHRPSYRQKWISRSSISGWLGTKHYFRDLARVRDDMGLYDNRSGKGFREAFLRNCSRDKQREDGLVIFFDS